MGGCAQASKNLTKMQRLTKVSLATPIWRMRGKPVKRARTIITSGERSVLLLVARGLTNSEIAARLDTTLSSVKTALYSACNKLDARNRIEAVLFAIRQRVISVNEVFTLPELVELTATLEPDSVERIADLLRQKLVQEWRQVGATAEQDKEIDLTAGERSVLILVGRGLTNKEIAHQLETSTGTVKLQLHQACLKLGASSRAQAFIEALRQRAVRVDEAFSLDELAELLAALGPDGLENMASQMRLKHACERPAHAKAIRGVPARKS